MGFSADTAIVTAAQVEGITYQGSLSLADRSSATVATLLVEATNAIIAVCRQRGIDPSAVTNTSDFKHAAAYWIVASIQRGSVDPQAQETSDRYEKLYDAAMERAVFQTPTSTRTISTRRALPRMSNLTAFPPMSRGINNDPGFPDQRFEQGY